MGNEPINILDLFSGIGGFSSGTEKRSIASTQRYKMLGNAVTKDIVELIATKLKENINI